MLNSNPVDSFGFLKAQLAELEKRADDIRAQVIALGTGAHEGETFRATVSVADRESVDWKTIAEKLAPSRQLVTAHTSAKSVTTVRVVAKTGKAA